MPVPFRRLLLLVWTSSAVALEPMKRLDAAAVTLGAPLPLASAPPVLAAPPPQVATAELDVPLGLRRRALREWMLEAGRMEGLGETVDFAEEGLSVVKATKAGDVIFALTNEAAVTAAAAYNDPDLVRLRATAAQAGPGFGVVAMAGLVAAERVRGFRTRLMSSCAPEAPGTVEPSEWGPAIRPIWAGARPSYDADLAPLVDQGVAILQPLLEAAARRSWSGPSPEKPAARTVFERGPDHFRSLELFADGAAPSWSRGDVEALARDAFARVLALRRPPPPYLAAAGANVAAADATGPAEWVQRCGDDATVSEPLALVPLLDEIVPSLDDVVALVEPNAVLGAPPPQRAGNRGAGQAIWCVAARDLAAGERVVALDPWE